MLRRKGYRIKIMNTINFKKSHHYNPFSYIHSEKDILKLVNCLIVNTKGEGGKSGDDFWLKAEMLLYTALIGYIHYEAPEEEQNFSGCLLYTSFNKGVIIHRLKVVHCVLPKAPCRELMISTPSKLFVPIIQRTLRFPCAG